MGEPLKKAKTSTVIGGVMWTRTAFILSARSCASLSILFLLDGFYVNGFWLALGMGLLFGVIGLRIASVFRCFSGLGCMVVEFLAQLGASILVVASASRLFGGILILDHTVLLMAGIGVGLLQLLASLALGRDILSHKTSGVRG